MNTIELESISIFIPVAKMEIVYAKTAPEFAKFTREELYHHAAKVLKIKGFSKSVKPALVAMLVDFVNMPIIEIVVPELTEKQSILKSKRVASGMRLAEFNRTQKELFAQIGSLLD
jgi:hypothetical protein